MHVTRLSRCLSQTLSTVRPGASAVATPFSFSPWLAQLHAATTLASSPTTVEGDPPSFSTLPLHALRALGRAVMDDAVHDRTTQLVAWSQSQTSQAGTARAGSTVESSLDGTGSSSSSSSPERRRPAVHALWGLPTEVVGVEAGEHQTSQESDALDSFFIVWAVHVVVAHWHASATGADGVCLSGSALLERWQHALRDDVKPLMDLFWLPASARGEDDNALSVGNSLSSLPPHSAAVCTARVCYLWSSLLFLSFRQIVPFVDDETAPPDWFRASLSLWDINVRHSLHLLLQQAMKGPGGDEGSEEGVYVARIRDQVATMDRVLRLPEYAEEDASRPSPSSSSSLTASPHTSGVLGEFVQSLFSCPAGAPPTGAATPLTRALPTYTDRDSLAVHVRDHAVAPLWRSPLSLARFRAAVVDTSDAYRSVYSDLAVSRDEQARVENDASRVADGDDADLIARVHQQLTKIAREGGNRPMV